MVTGSKDTGSQVHDNDRNGWGLHGLYTTRDTNATRVGMH